MSFDNSDSLTSLAKSKECTAASIVKALDGFMGAMSRMEDIVMIPSRLKDLEAPLPVPPTVRSGQLSHPPSRASSSLTLSLQGPKSAPPAISTPIRASSLDGNGAPLPTADLFTYYRMLDTLRHELMGGAEGQDVMGHGGNTGADSGVSSIGEATDDDLSSLDSEDLRESESARLAATFRQHLHGLATVMHQLTLTANLVSDKYQDEVLHKSSP